MNTTTATIPFADADHNYIFPLVAPPVGPCTFAEIVRAPATLGPPIMDNPQVTMYGDGGTTPGTGGGGVYLLAIVRAMPNLPANAGELVIAHDGQPNFTGPANTDGMCFAVVWLPSGPFGDRTVEVTG